ncbi:MAG: PDDEXK nuclease domain-containing protein [Bacteroidetes bacterium]|nr:PDDEXK nuclease domain-containing protein [Bacteroidota bacterium]
MNFDLLIQKLQITHNTLFTAVSKAVNIAMTVRNWLYGYYIVEFEQNGEDRAKYGEKLIRSIGENLKEKGLKGMSFTNLNLYRQFYLTYPQIGKALPSYFNNMQIIQTPSEQLSVSRTNQKYQTLSEQLKLTDIQLHKSEISEVQFGIDPEKILKTLSFSHFVELIKIEDSLKRAFYELECTKGTWSVRELQRQIESLYFERSGLSKDKKKLSEMINRKAVQLTPRDIINDPVTVEFLGLSDRAIITESDLEQALLDHLQQFLLELGHGFCFEARQKRILIDDEYYFVDLVFYHRILKCHILVELKTEKFKHYHASQINTYLEYYRHEIMHQNDNPPVGILLCTDKGEALVKYATAGMEKSLFVHKYLVELPKKEALEKYLKTEVAGLIDEKEFK